MIGSRIIDLPPQQGAGIEVAIAWPTMGPVIRQLFDRIYKPGALVPGHGHNFILYAEETREGATMTVGVLDRQPGGADPDVKATHLPGGRVITAPHFGDYGKMRSTYDVLHADVKAKGLRRAPMSLEIYGDWSDDPAKVRTDLHLYLGMAI